MATETTVINQSNATHLTSMINMRTSKQSKLLHDPSLWHKVVIHNIPNNVDRETMLKAILNTVYPCDLIPVSYKMEGPNACFLARNCVAAIEKLCRHNLLIDHAGQVFVLSVIIGHSDTDKTKLNVQDNISSTILQRYSESTKTLNLDCFHKDPDLSGLIFCVLSQPKILYFVLHLCKKLPFTHLKLSNNEIRSLGAIEVLSGYKNLTVLDLRNNMIADAGVLSSLSSLDITELWLDGNPLCEKYDDHGYMEAIKEICPKLEKLDGILLSKDGFPALRRNFLVKQNGLEFVDQFLEHFFSLYDMSNRMCLDGMYHKNALFSLTSTFLVSQTTSFSARLERYRQHIRNILTISDFSKVNQTLYCGADKILKTLCSLPLTEHDPYSFTVDLVHYSPETVVLIVTGVFREAPESIQDLERLVGFTRTFVLAAAERGEYKITNEMLHVSNATTIQAQKAFKIVKVVRPRHLVMRPASNSKEQREMIDALMRITNLNEVWATKLLTTSKWDMKDTLTGFVDRYKKDDIPSEAFKEK